MEKYLRICKQLVDKPYNKFNLDNYLSVINKKFDNSFTLIPTSDEGPIRLMSNNHPKSGVITSKQEQKTKRNIYIVGKGILFDSGGYNLKGNSMKIMKLDMAGMSSALAVSSIVKKAIPFCPVSSNLLNSKILPGDYLEINDKVVEVTNTDAEGRLILAETLSQLNPSKNDIVITVATLTGAVAYAVGEATAILTPNNNLAKDYKKASDKVGELSWRLPLWNYLEKKHFNKKSIKNSVKEECGTITAGLFLKQFVKYPQNWIHLDIAESAFSEDKEKATGVPVKSLAEFIKKL